MQLAKIDAVKDTLTGMLGLVDQTRSNSDTDIVMYMLQQYQFSKQWGQDVADGRITLSELGRHTLLNSTIRAAYNAAQCDRADALAKRFGTSCSIYWDVCSNSKWCVCICTGDTGSVETPYLCNVRVRCAHLREYMNKGVAQLEAREADLILRSNFAYLVFDSMTDDSMKEEIQVLLSSNAQREVKMRLTGPLRKSLLKWIQNATEGVEIFRAKTIEQVQIATEALVDVTQNMTRTGTEKVTDVVDLITSKFHETLSTIAWWLRATIFLSVFILIMTLMSK
jgi:hypothetical protein